MMDFIIVVESVEAQNRGLDPISRCPHPATAVDVRFIEVKGHAAVGEVAITTNEFKTAERLKNDYWVYVVYNCSPSRKFTPFVILPASAGSPLLRSITMWLTLRLLLRQRIS
jgi:hypothetical protein